MSPCILILGRQYKSVSSPRRRKITWSMAGRKGARFAFSMNRSIFDPIRSPHRSFAMDR